MPAPGVSRPGAQGATPIGRRHVPGLKGAIRRPVDVQHGLGRIGALDRRWSTGRVGERQQDWFRPGGTDIGRDRIEPPVGTGEVHAIDLAVVEHAEVGLLIGNAVRGSIGHEGRRPPGEAIIVREHHPTRRDLVGVDLGRGRRTRTAPVSTGRKRMPHDIGVLAPRRRRVFAIVSAPRPDGVGIAGMASAVPSEPFDGSAGTRGTSVG